MPLAPGPATGGEGLAVRVLVRAALAAAGALGLLVATPNAAMAAAPAPNCESGASRYLCLAASGGPTTWTVTYIFSGAQNPVVITYHTAGSSLSTNCSNPGKTVRVYYSYVDANGVTQTSATRSFTCNPRDWP